MPLYVTYRNTDGKLEPISIVEDTSLVEALSNSGQINGYFIAYRTTLPGKEVSATLNSPIDTLPWEMVERESSERRHRRPQFHVLAALKRARFHTQDGPYFQNPHTVGDILDYFAKQVARYGRPFSGTTSRPDFGINNFGRGSYEVTREVFRRVGFELPDAGI